MKPIQSFVSWIDRDLERNLGSGRRPVSFCIIFLPALIGLIGDAINMPHKPIWAVTFALFIATAIFWFWRCFLAMGKLAAKSDSLYDRKIKYLLPPEYADTHSATKAAELSARRKKR